MTRRLTVEVAVVGGGPAGLTAAIALAEAGIETALIARRAADDHRTTALLAGSVTGWQVGCSVSGGRLLSPRWPLVGLVEGCNTSSPLTPALVSG